MNHNINTVPDVLPVLCICVLLSALYWTTPLLAEENQAYKYKSKLVLPTGIGREVGRRDNPDGDEDEEFLLEGSISGYGSIVLTQEAKDGAGNDIPEDVFSVTLPLLKDEDIDFIMDPNGILHSDPDKNIIYDGSSIYFTHSGTEPLLNTGVSRIGMAVNKGTIPVRLHVDLAVSNETDVPVEYTKLEKLESDEKMNMVFYIIPTEESRIGNNTNDAGYSDNSNNSNYTNKSDYSDYQGIQNSILLNEDKAETDASGRADLDIYLDSAKENFTVIMEPVEVEREEKDSKDATEEKNKNENKNENTYKYIIEELGSGEALTWPAAGFAIGGALNTKADWSELMNYTGEGKLGINVIYYVEPFEEEMNSGDGIDSEEAYIKTATASDAIAIKTR